MTISDSELKDLAKLARLSLEGEDTEKLVSEISKVIEHVKVLQEVDTTGVAPMSHVHGLTNVFREDEVKDSLTQEEALSMTALKEDGHFKVPAAIEGGAKK